MRLAAILCSTLLAGCCWWSGAPLPEPATDHGLSGAESNLDHLTDKRDSRVASAQPRIIREGNWLSSARILAMHDPMKVRRLQRGAPVDSSETSAKVF